MPDPVTIIGDNPNDAALRNVRVVSDPEAPFVLVNASAAAQVLVAEAGNYLVGSALKIPRSRVVGAGTLFRWVFTMTKTAAGIAASTVQLKVGTGGTIADTTRLAFTKPAGTAAVDEARVEIRALVRTGGATGTWAGHFSLVHNLASTGHATIPCVAVTGTPAAFDMTPRHLIFGVSVIPGAADAITVEMVDAEVRNLAVATS